MLENMHTIYLTTCCNFRCSYCYEDYKNHITITESKLKKTLDFIFNYDKNERVSIGFMGGEPLLKKELVHKAVEYISENYPDRILKYHMTTNCSLIDDELIELMKNNSFSLRLSFDGTKEAHDINRISIDGQSCYDTILKNIFKVRDSGIPYSIRMTITGNTIPLLYDNVVFLHKNHLDKICLILDVNLLFTEELLKEFKIQMIKIQKYYLDEHDKGRYFSIDQFNGKFLSMLCDFGNCFSMCSAGVASYKYMPNGDIYPCGFVTHDENFKIGNIETTINTNAAKKLAYSLFNKESKKCTDCKMKDFCHGMKCGYMNYIRTGSINEPSDLTCQYEHIFYPLVVEIIEHIGENKKINGRLSKYYEFIKFDNLKLSEFGAKIKDGLIS